jgi:excisionase family DNA binding protein
VQVDDLSFLPGDRLALGAAEAAPALGISERSLWTLTKSGDIPHVRIGRRVLYPVRALDTWLEEQAKGGRGA